VQEVLAMGVRGEKVKGNQRMRKEGGGVKKKKKWGGRRIGGKEIRATLLCKKGSSIPWTVWGK